MLCQKCHKNLATVRYAEVVNGKVMDLHLCGECLSKHQETASAGFELSGPVAAAGAAARGRPSAPRIETRVKSPRVCKSCGTQLKSVLETGKAGCAACYGVFSEEIEPLLEGLHGNTHHFGKLPRVDDSRVTLRASLQAKRALLRSALQSESYEEAAVLRDTIRQLETELGNPDGN